MTKICIPLRAKTLSELLEKIKIASPQGDILELWLDQIPLNEEAWSEIFAVKKTPYILVVKTDKEQGAFPGTHEEKLNILLTGRAHGAEYIDLDAGFPEEMIKKCIQKKGTAKLILSAHFFEETPAPDTLKRKAEKMKSLGADIIKIATMANEKKDLITILRLSEYLKRQDQRFITISMGLLGKPSRILTPLMGGEIMFAALNAEEATAPGQITAIDLRSILHCNFNS